MYGRWINGWDLDPIDYDADDFRPEPTQEEAREIAAEEFHRMAPRARAWARRLAKRSTTRRRTNREWRARQRREDINAQVIF